MDRFLSSRTLEPVDTQLAKLGLLGDDDAGVIRATVAGVLNQPLRLTEVHDSEWSVRFIDLFGKSSLLEYHPPAR